jgi:cytochrome c peroxidase
MPRALLLLLLLALPAGGLLIRRPPATPAPATVSAQERLRRSYLRDLDSLEAAIARLAAATRVRDGGSAQRAFRDARGAYKQIEYRVAYEMLEADLAINGPPLPRVNEYASDGVLPPTGLQVIEAVLFPEPSAKEDSVVAAQIRLMRPTLMRLRKQRTSGVDADAWLFDALRQELARLSTLGLAGFDATVTGDGIRESAAALRGVREAAAAYEPGADAAARIRWAELDRRLADAIAELEDHPDFDRFDRLGFLVRDAAPIARALTAYQSALGVALIRRPHTWSAEASSIFDADAIDPVFYAPSDLARDPRVVALGRRLFFSPALSASGARACATCHQPARAFTDGRRLAQTDPGAGQVRNTPTLLHASVQPFQFADQRARSLEDQVAMVMANPREMNQPVGAAVARLRQDPAVAREFAAAFGGPGSEALTERRLQIAIAAFVRSLPGFASRFDRAVRGDTTALSAAERRGFDLFMGKAACATCHFAPVFGGALPPTLLESEPEVIGVPSRPDTAGARIDADPGVAGFDHATIHRHAFKTPSLRNVELTAPYMHNGVYRTLEDVVDFYDRGGGAGIGIELPNQTLSPEPLRLSAREKRDLVAFMRALTDSTQVARDQRH